jgi:hypothetical protein
MHAKEMGEKLGKDIKARIYCLFGCHNCPTEDSDSLNSLESH